MTAAVLIDQCVSRRMITRAIGANTDVVFIADLARGATDRRVLQIARESGRILITEDFDFGVLVFKEELPPPPGVIHLILSRMNARERESKFAAEFSLLLAAAPGRFVVFSRGPMRSRPLP